MTAMHPRGRPRPRLVAAALAAGALAATAVLVATRPPSPTRCSATTSPTATRPAGHARGSWSVVTDGSLAFRQSGTSSDARALASARVGRTTVSRRGSDPPGSAARTGTSG
ncbi:hypothetical protein NKG94_05970 [Micromonospora sp. M12]